MWSPEVYRIHALDPDTFSPDLDKLLGLMHPDDRPRVEEIIRSADSDRRSRTMEYRIIRSDGQIRFVRSHGEWTTGADGKPQIVGTVQDITELKEIEEQFRHVQRVESVGNLAGGIAHDFNNLLTVINGYSQMLAAHMTPGSVEHAQLTEIHRAGERGALLTRQLLSFSRKQMIQPAELSLNEVVNSTVGLLRPLLGEAIELKLDLSSDLHTVTGGPRSARAGDTQPGCQRAGRHRGGRHTDHRDAQPVHRQLPVLAPLGYTPGTVCVPGGFRYRAWHG